jgi:hypothetical protein
VAVFLHELSAYLGSTWKLSFNVAFLYISLEEIVIKYRFAIVSENTKKEFKICI